MKRWLGFATATATLTLSGAAMAQFSSTRLDATPYDFSFRAGVVVPWDSDLRDIADSWIGIGIDYTFTKQFIRGSETFFSLDMITKSSQFQRGTYWPILLNQRFYFGQYEDEKRTYAIIGAGVVVVDVVSSDTVFGGRLGFGVELGPNMFLELNNFLSAASTGSITTNSSGLYLGYRF